MPSHTISCLLTPPHTIVGSFSPSHLPAFPPSRPLAFALPPSHKWSLGVSIVLILNKLCSFYHLFQYYQALPRDAVGFRDVQDLVKKLKSVPKGEGDNEALVGEGDGGGAVHHH